MSVNSTIFQTINDLGKDFPIINPLFIFLAEYMLYFLALFLVIFWFTRIYHNRLMVIQAVLAFILAEIFGKLVSTLHSNYQPFVEMEDVNLLIVKEVNNSFPSDHTIVFFSICVSFALMRKHQWYIWLPLAGLVGLSRIWVGVHYPADVAVGAILATLAALIMYRITPHLRLVRLSLEKYSRMENKVFRNQ